MLISLTQFNCYESAQTLNIAGVIKHVCVPTCKNTNIQQRRSQQAPRAQQVQLFTLRKVDMQFDIHLYITDITLVFEWMLIICYLITFQSQMFPFNYIFYSWDNLFGSVWDFTHRTCNQFKRNTA